MGRQRAMCSLRGFTTAKRKRSWYCEKNGFHRSGNLLQVSKLLLEVLEANELTGLGISLEKPSEGQKCKLLPGREGCVAVTDQHLQPQALLPSQEKEGRKIPEISHYYGQI